MPSVIIAPADLKEKSGAGRNSDTVKQTAAAIQCDRRIDSKGDPSFCIRIKMKKRLKVKAETRARIFPNVPPPPILPVNIIIIPAAATANATQCSIRVCSFKRAPL